MEPSISSGDNFVGIGFPDERLCFSLVVLGDEPVDCRLQFIDGFEHTVFQAPAGELGKAETIYLQLLERYPKAEKKAEAKVALKRIRKRM